MDLPNAEDLKALVAALAPGLIILGIRQRFIAAPPPELIAQALTYAGVSAVYYALARPLFAWCAAHSLLPIWLEGAFEQVVLPALIGAAAAIEVHAQWVDKLWRRFGAFPVHPDPTAWDHLFFRRVQPHHFVIVTMDDGSMVFGRGTFASSSTDERDLLVEEVWDIDDSGNWREPDDPTSILICGKNIRYVQLTAGKRDDAATAD